MPARSVPPQEIVERTLAAAGRLHGCAVLVTASSEAVLRWANSTMTTNGHSTTSSVTVIAFVALDGGVGAGVAASGVAVSDGDQLTELVAAAEAAARDAGPAEDAMPLPERGGTDPSWDDPADATSIAVFAPFVEGLADVLTGPAQQYGFARTSPRCGWAPPPACGGAGCSRPGRWS
jgi:predicted Zn-dependent protease